MTDGARLTDREIWRMLKEKFNAEPFRFRDVVELCSPERAYEFMQLADEEGWIQVDEDGKTYELQLEVEPEDIKAEKTAPPSVPSKAKEFEEWYRGTKFHLGARGSITWISPRKKVKIGVVSGFEDLVDKIRSARPLGGSFRVDENGRVLVKDPNHDYEVTSIGKVKKIEFDSIERDPRSRVKPGYIWPSIYDGARYHISQDGKVWFRNPDGSRRYAKSGHESLVGLLLKYKPKGGSFRITENGRVLTLRYTFPVPEEARAQWETLTDEERNIVKARETPGEDLLIPVFVTDFKGKIELGPPFDIHKPWTDEEKKDFFDMLAGRTGGDM